MRYCKVYLNKESKELETKCGLYVYGIITNQTTRTVTRTRPKEKMRKKEKFKVELPVYNVSLIDYEPPKIHRFIDDINVLFNTEVKNSQINYRYITKIK